jgi:Flp pilus assembly pilin Flp
MQRRGWGERGVTSVEYALMITIIVLLLVGGAAALFDAIQSHFEADADCAAEAYKDVGC